MISKTVRLYTIDTDRFGGVVRIKVLKEKDKNKEKITS